MEINGNNRNSQISFEHLMAPLMQWSRDRSLIFMHVPAAQNRHRHNVTHFQLHLHSPQRKKAKRENGTIHHLC